MVNCENKFSPDFIYLVEQLFSFIKGELKPDQNSGIRRIISFGTQGVWFAVSKETLNILYEEFKYFPLVNIGGDLLFIEQVTQ